MESKIKMINMKLDFIIKELNGKKLSADEKSILIRSINNILRKIKIAKKYEKDLLDKIKDKL
jgi:hypothetical protein